MRKDIISIMTTDAVDAASKDQENAVLRSNFQQLEALHEDLSTTAGAKVVSLAKESTNILVPFEEVPTDELSGVSTYSAIEQYQRLVTEGYLISLGAPTPAYPTEKGRGEAIETRREELKQRRAIIEGMIQKQRRFETSEVYKRIQSIRTAQN